MEKQTIIAKLNEIEAIKYGEFTLKSGLTSPYYVDLRLIISYPELLKELAEEMWNKISHLSFDLICGVPYTAIPLATTLSVLHNIPMVMRRKEKKDYGRKKMLEGVYEKGQTCLIIEDLVTTGSSVLDTTELLESEGLIVKDIAVILDRQQGGQENLTQEGYTLHSLVNIDEVLILNEINDKTIQRFEG